MIYSLCVFEMIGCQAVPFDFARSKLKESFCREVGHVVQKWVFADEFCDYFNINIYYAYVGDTRITLDRILVPVRHLVVVRSPQPACCPNWIWNECTTCLWDGCYGLADIPRSLLNSCTRSFTCHGSGIPGQRSRDTHLGMTSMRQIRIIGARSYRRVRRFRSPINNTWECLMIDKNLIEQFLWFDIQCNIFCKASIIDRPFWDIITILFSSLHTLLAIYRTLYNQDSLWALTSQ